MCVFGLLILLLEERDRIKISALSFFLIITTLFFGFNLRQMNNWRKSEGMAKFINSKSNNQYSVGDVYRYFYMEDSNKDLKVKFINVYEKMLEDKKEHDYIWDTVEELVK